MEMADATIAVESSVAALSTSTEVPTLSKLGCPAGVESPAASPMFKSLVTATSSSGLGSDTSTAAAAPFPLPLMASPTRGSLDWSSLLSEVCEEIICPTLSAVSASMFDGSTGGTPRPDISAVPFRCAAPSDVGGAESRSGLAVATGVLSFFAGPFAFAFKGVFGDLAASGFFSETGLVGDFLADDTALDFVVGSFEADLGVDLGLAVDLGLKAEAAVFAGGLRPVLVARSGDFLESADFTAGAFAPATLEVLGEAVVALGLLPTPETPLVLTPEAARVLVAWVFLAPVSAAPVRVGTLVAAPAEAVVRVVEVLVAGFVVEDLEEGMEDSDLEAREDLGLAAARREVVVVVLEVADLADGLLVEEEEVPADLVVLFKDVAAAFGFLAGCEADGVMALPLQAAFSPDEARALSVEAAFSPD